MSRVQRLEKNKFLKKEYVLAMVLIAISAGFWVYSLWHMSFTDPFQNMVQLRMTNTPIDVPKAEDMLENRTLEKEEISLNVWTEKKNVSVSNKETGVSTEVSTGIFYSGDNDAFFDIFLENGCVLPEQMAYNLFGTTEEILGEMVQVGEKDFILEKIAYGKNAAAVFKLGGKAVYNDILLDVVNTSVDAAGGQVAGDQVADSEVLEGIIYRENLKSDLTLHYSDLISFVSAAKGFVFWIFIIALFVLFFRFSWKNKWRLVEKKLSESEGLYLKKVGFGFKGAIFICVIIIVILILLKLAVAIFGAPFYIPDSLIPTRWSQLDFWGYAFDTYKKNIDFYFSMEVYTFDHIFQTHGLKAIVSGWCSGICAGIALMTIRKQVGKRLIGGQNGSNCI